MESFLATQLEELQDKNLLRKVRTLRSIKGNQAVLEGRKILLFCANDYLGLAQHPKVIEAFVKVAEECGVGSGAARLISGSTTYHADLEDEIARFKKKEKALLFSSGYLANVGSLSALANDKDLIIMDKLCHASLIDGAKLSGAKLRVFPHKNYKRCKELLSHTKSYRKTWIVSDSVFSMDGDLADLATLIHLKKEYGALLILDDAHGTGVIGKEGRGAYEDLKFEKEIDLILGTLSKAVGCLGGFAVGSKNMVDYLTNHARSFIFTTSLPAAVCAAAQQSLKMMKTELSLKDKLWANIRFAEKLLKQSGFEIGQVYSPIIPILLGSEKRALEVSQELFDGGFLVPAIRYPTVSKNKARLRLTLNSNHEKADIQALVRLLGSLRVS